MCFWYIPDFLSFLWVLNCQFSSTNSIDNWYLVDATPPTALDVFFSFFFFFFFLSRLFHVVNFFVFCLISIYRVGVLCVQLLLQVLTDLLNFCRHILHRLKICMWFGHKLRFFVTFLTL